MPVAQVLLAGEMWNMTLVYVTKHWSQVAMFVIARLRLVLA